jgi:predicted Zn-dependent protease
MKQNTRSLLPELSRASFNFARFAFSAFLTQCYCVKGGLMLIHNKSVRQVRAFPQSVLACLFMLLFTVGVMTAFGQTQVKPGFNLFSPKQDIEIGRQSVVEAEKQLPVLRDAQVTGYLNRLGQRLAAQAQGEKFPYTFKVVNASDINAFALPGGPVYINRGTVEAAQSEAQLAGVVAHEIAHVALRHGTHQASKAYLAQAGLGVLGGVLGGGSVSKIIGAVGGVGLNTLFLKYSRDAETQADVVGAQIMARAGYNPLDMARFFETLQQEAGRDPSKLEKFLSDHPPPADRTKRIEKEVAMLNLQERGKEVGGFSAARSKLLKLPKAPKLSQIIRMPY